MERASVRTTKRGRLGVEVVRSEMKPVSWMLPVGGLFLVKVCGSVLLPELLLGSTSPPMAFLASTVSLSSSASAGAWTRGGRPGGSVAGRTGMGLGDRVTGTTATGTRGGRGAAIGTSGLTSGGRLSDGGASLYAGDWGRRPGGSRTAALGGAASSSFPESARPFKAAGPGV